MSRLFLIICMIVTCLFSVQIKGQTKNLDTKQGSSHYDTLKAQIAEQPNDSLKLLLASTALQKAKGQLDTLVMADAYLFLSEINRQTKINYLDSLIRITNNKKYKRYPALGYLRKGNTEYEKGNFQEALEFYLTASKFAKQNGNEYLYQSLKFNIGLLKNVLGEVEESQDIFVDYLTFLDQNPKYKRAKVYNRAIFALADSYLRNGQYDLADVYTNRGILETLKTDDILTYSTLVLNSGVLNYRSKNYKKAIDSTEKAKNYLQELQADELRIAICNYYLGCSYHAIGAIEESITHFKEVDDFHEKKGSVFPILLDSYNYLIDYHKSKKDLIKQLEYINKLLKFDSIRDDNHNYLSKNIIKRYETAELLSEKEDLINALQQDQSLKKETIIILITILIAVVLIAVYGYRRSYVHKKRFLKLLDKRIQQQTIPVTATKKVKTTQINQETLDHLLTQLQGFEEQQIYLNRDINAKDLAKKFGSNSSYLSIVVNTYKQKGMSQYINDLRIDYVVGKLQSDPKLRKYTIKAIAQEIGFKSAEVFAKTFYKKTGIYPSYFIKKLEKQDSGISI